MQRSNNLSLVLSKISEIGNFFANTIVICAAQHNSAPTTFASAPVPGVSSLDSGRHSAAPFFA